MHFDSFYGNSISLITSPDEERSHKIYIDAETNKIVAYQNLQCSLVFLPIASPYPNLYNCCSFCHHRLDICFLAFPVSGIV